MQKLAYCHNSRRWLFFMDLSMQYPKTCPYDGECDKHYCGYFEERKPTNYMLRKMRLSIK